MKTKTIQLYSFIIFFSILLLSISYSQPYNTYYGMMHSHTSQGGDDGTSVFTHAFTFARDTAKLNFFGISPHSHMLLSNPTGKQAYQTLISTASTFTNNSTFVAFANQEWGTISLGGHITIVEANSICTVDDGDFSTLYNSWLPSHPEAAYAQFNHPHQTDFGNAYSANGAQFVKLLEVYNGSAFDTGTTESQAGSSFESDYTYFLNQGWKVGASADQDNHEATWGLNSPNRTGVLASSLTKSAILSALKARRTFTTQDHNLHLTFISDGVHYQGEEYSRLTGTVTFTVNTWDPNSNDTIKKIELYYDQITGGSTASVVSTINLSVSSTQVNFTRTLGIQSSYFFVRVTEGDGDKAWSSPIWITALGVLATDSIAPTFGGITSASDATTGGSINLAWAPASDSSLPISYNIYRSTITQGEDTTSPVASGLTSNAFTDSGLTNGVTYYYIVRAKDAAGNIDSNTTEKFAMPSGTLIIGTNGVGDHIVINEFKPKGTPEWIELYNPTTTSYNLTGWILTTQIGDNNGALTTSLSLNLPAGAYATYTAGTTSGTTQLSNDGDIISLYKNSSTLVDQVGYGNRGGAPVNPTAGFSGAVGRLNDGIDTDSDADDFNLTTTPTAGTTNTGLPASLTDSVIKLNEIEIPKRVELYNSSSSVVDISGWHITESDTMDTITSGTIVPAGGYSIVTLSDTISLSNTAGDVIYLFDSNYVRFDQVGVRGISGSITTTIQTLQRIVDGEGTNLSYDYGSATTGGWYVGTSTMGFTNTVIIIPGPTSAPLWKEPDWTIGQ